MDTTERGDSYLMIDGAVASPPRKGFTLKEETGGESRGDGGEREGDFTNNLYFSENVSLELIYVGWVFW